jgi:hypothetical protein
MANCDEIDHLFLVREEKEFIQLTVEKAADRRRT